MISITTEKVYIVRKGSKKIVVELCRTSDGKLFVVPLQTLQHKYVTKEEEEKEWSYDTAKAEEIDYMSLPQNIRKALSHLHTL
ncbi:MAG: hypothetical protein QXW05_04235 [Ignisphaera sp.]